jgi:hypothetical protein
MSNSLKKILTLQLFAALVFSQVGYYFFYAIKQYQIKEAAKHQLLCTLPESSLQIFAADDKNIVWEEDEKEFSIDGKMFDVAKIKIVNAKKYLYCISDEKETTLINNLALAVKSKTDNKQQKDSKHTIKFQTISFQDLEDIFERSLYKKITIKFPIIEQKTTTAIVSVVSPPPKSIINFIL